MIRRSAILAGLAGAVLTGSLAMAQDVPPPSAAPSQETVPQETGPQGTVPEGGDVAPPDAPPADAPPSVATPPDATAPDATAPEAAPPEAAGPDQAAAQVPSDVSLAPPPPPGAPLVPPPAPVQAQSLDALDLFSAGRDTGLGADLWKGSSAALARTVIPTLGDKPLSPAAVHLARRMLATGANAPGDAGTDADLDAARVRSLLALGDAPAVEAILDRTPNLSANADLSRAGAEAALILGDPDKACRIGDQLSVGRDGLYWLRLRAFCQAMAGKTAEAQLTLTLAQQEGADPDYVRLMGVVLAGAGDPGKPSLRDGVDYALSRKLQLDLTPALADAPPAIAEQVRASLPPPAAAPAAPPASPPGATPAVPPLPSETDVAAALRAAKGPAAYVAAARAQAPAIDALVQAKASLANPVQLATAALAAGDLPAAQAIRAGLTQDAIPGAGSVDLAILDAALAVAAGKPDPQTLDRLAERGGAGDPAARPRAQAAAAIFAPLAGRTGPAARAAIAGFDLGRGAPAGPLLALDLAADAGARGDVGLLVLAIAQAAGADGPDPAVRAELVRALARAGMAEDARALALEGLIGLQAR